MKLFYPITIPPARVGQPFAANPPDYARFDLAGHDGQDFPTPIGTPVLAAHDGFISACNSSNSAYGLYLAIAWEEDGVIYENIYGHFSQLNYPDFTDNVFNKTYPVKAGDVIGLSGNTGNSTGPHLHFGLRTYNLQGQLLNRDNGFLGCVDPMPYLQGEFVNQAKLVKSKHSPTIYVCYPIPSEGYLREKGSMEGIEIPADLTTIPDSDSLT